MARTAAERREAHRKYKMDNSRWEINRKLRQAGCRLRFHDLQAQFEEGIERALILKGDPTLGDGKVWVLADSETEMSFPIIQIREALGIPGETMFVKSIGRTIKF